MTTQNQPQAAGEAAHTPTFSLGHALQIAKEISLQPDSEAARWLKAKCQWEHMIPAAVIMAYGDPRDPRSYARAKVHVQDRETANPAHRLTYQQLLDSHAALVEALASLERKAREVAEYPHACEAKSQLAYRLKQLEAGANEARAALKSANQ